MPNTAPDSHLPPLSLYIHLPWCVKKCPYCDFNSHASHNKDIPEQEYIDALQQDLLRDLAYTASRPLQSIFFGGGTPSLFSAKAIARILQFIQQHIAFAPDIEITMEANPGTFEQQKFADFRAADINRLSIGVQSFNDQHLQRLGRIHNSNNALAAFNMARKAGFDNINIDLMHGLESQTPEQAINDLQTAIELQTEHISWYELTIEPNTEFFNQPPTIPAENILDDIQVQGLDMLASAGFNRYEVSAYCQDQQRSTHNMNYWQFGDYIGIGAGAHSKYTDLDGNIYRSHKTRVPNDYMKRYANHSLIQTASSQQVSTDDQLGEFLMNGLRLLNGFPLAFIEQRTQLKTTTILEALAPLQARGFIDIYSNDIGPWVQPSDIGIRYLNTVLSEYL